MRTCVINVANTSKRIAVMNDKRLDALYLEQQGQQNNVGNIYIGKVVKVQKGMQAAFVDIGLDKNGYLHCKDVPNASSEKDRDIASLLTEGEAIVVQIAKEGIGGKGPKLTAIIEFSGQNMVYLPHGNYVAVSKKIPDESVRENLRKIGQDICRDAEGLVIRTTAQDAERSALEGELSALREKYALMKQRSALKKAPNLLWENYDFVQSTLEAVQKRGVDEIVIDDFDLYQQLSSQSLPVHYYRENEGIFHHYDVEAELERLQKRVVWLKNGAYLVVDQTEAMTVVDVNTGKFSGKNSFEETVLDTNLLAANEVARQVRLRNIGGIILVDFINMKNPSHRKRIEQAMKEALQEDDVRTTIVGFTELGILQLTRKKTKESIEEALMIPCQTCSGTGKVLSDETIVYQLERALWEHRHTEAEAIWVEVKAGVPELMKQDGFLAHLEGMLKLKLFMTVSPKSNVTYEIRHVGTIQDIENRLS
ncbi:Rne/Rng family ribonuclease [Priestia koreensis]|uniref:Rne/Rng family ribonuclease n=1 Tax=Priestia koreensis TaxID=284581 RepID=UPI001F5617CE|nr:Rne/Rng family ribonuclease [Priestia koreensis]UNL84344.1 Rne/Rng family ribonuclease [Priestia koreensis]